MLNGAWPQRGLLAVGLGLCTIAVTLDSQAPAPGPAPAVKQTSGAPLRWYRGNTHTHTLNSDGDSTPDEVVRWYREHGYQFLVLTDHNFMTGVDGLNALHGADEKFLVIRGEEVTSTTDSKPIHVNGLDGTQSVGRQTGATRADTLQRSVDAIRGVSGIPHINHPNFQWALTAQDLQQTKNYKLLEIYNGHPTVNNIGGGGVPGLEEIWDRLLSSGPIVYGIAVDDAHTFKDPGNPKVAGPGRGWVTVRAPRLEKRAVLDALERGDFYASTGVVLDDVRATATELTVEVRPEATSKYRIQFIGRGGAILSEVAQPSATYTFKGSEGYVRATVIESNGKLAWVQPIAIRAQAHAWKWEIYGALAGVVALLAVRKRHGEGS